MIQIAIVPTPKHLLEGLAVSRSRLRLISLWIAGLAVFLLAACGGGGGASPGTGTVPATPGGMVVTPGNNQATVTWNAVAGATSYNIYRSTTQGQEGAKVGASTSTSYVDASAVNGTTYYYEITADNAAGEGAASTQSPAVTPTAPIVAPDAPSGLTVVAGNAKITLNWTAVTGAASYNVYRSTASGSQGTKVGASASTSYVDTTVANGTAYYYEVTADDDAGEGPASAQSAAVTPAVPVTVPAAPTGVSATAGNGQVAVNWTVVSGATSYNIYRYTGQATQGVKVGASTTTSYTDTTAANGTTYSYAVTADNAAGESPASSHSAGVTPAVPVTVPAAATGVNVVAGNANVVVTWTASAGATSYNIYRSTSRGSQGSKIGNNPGTSYTDGTAANGTTYYYEVTALNAAGESPASTQSAAATPAVPVTLPAAPTGVNATAGNAQVSVSWTAAPTATSYKVYRSTTQGSQGTQAGTSSGTSYTDSTAVNGTTYYYEVTAVNSAGEGPTSTQSAAATPAAPTSSGPAAALAKRLGLPNRFLIGLGTGGSDTALIAAQGLKPDFYERYLVGTGTNGGWATWNTPYGQYALYQMQAADSVGAVPMFTLFQFSADNLSDMTNLADATFMQTYWSDLIVLFNQMKTFGKPTVLSVEPDFFGFAQAVVNSTYGGDPTKAPAVLSTDAACAGLPANLTGFSPCLMKLARKYAPKAAIGFTPSSWGGPTITSVVSFMNQLGTDQADLIVTQTTDRDAGCREQYVLTPATTQSDCSASAGQTWYWDETNRTHPNFQDNFAIALAYHNGLGGLPVLWWQTPFGAPSNTPGGTLGHFRDNKVDYFLKHPAELVAVGGLGVVFGAGAENQTTPSTDGGQYQTLSAKYLANPVPLP